MTNYTIRVLTIRAEKAEAEIDRLRRVLERIADYDEVSLGRTLAQDALGRLGPNQG